MCAGRRNTRNESWKIILKLRAWNRTNHRVICGARSVTTSSNIQQFSKKKRGEILPKKINVWTSRCICRANYLFSPLLAWSGFLIFGPLPLVSLFEARGCISSRQVELKLIGELPSFRSPATKCTNFACRETFVDITRKFQLFFRGELSNTDLPWTQRGFVWLWLLRSCLLVQNLNSGQFISRRHLTASSEYLARGNIVNLGWPA